MGVGATMISPKDTMILLYVPAGKFRMGAKAEDALVECQKFRSDCQLDWFKNEQPPHEVYLDAFWIDQTEVTNKMYALCVSTGACDEPTKTTSYTHSGYYGNSEYDNYPVIYIDWIMAKTYCEWAGRRLPTEAEWEKAARGPNGNIYPWGNTFNNGGTLANVCDTNCPFAWASKSLNDQYGDVAPVGNYPAGQSVYGALDMAGNVWEWVSSLYKLYPYDATDGREDLSAFGNRVLRGGSWGYDLGVILFNISSAYRGWDDPMTANAYFGFRCAKDVAP